MFFVYVLYDESRDKYYVGQTGNLEDRLGRHFQKRSKYTKGGYWKLIYKEMFTTRPEAVAREKEIKDKKSKSFVRNLVGGASRL